MHNNMLNIEYKLCSFYHLFIGLHKEVTLHYSQYTANCLKKHFVKYIYVVDKRMSPTENIGNVSYQSYFNSL